MAYWLLKSEPGTWSWGDQVAAGTTEWDGVRNHQARNNLAAMQVGDRAFFYHSIHGTEIVGIVEVVRDAHSDSTDTSGKWLAVEVCAVRPMQRPVSIKAIKAEPRLADMVLSTNSRLSVQPVAEEEWLLVCEMGHTSPD